MGGKGSNNLESDRPESGGADRDDIREKSGILERNKDELARHEAERHRAKPAPNDESGESSADRDGPYADRPGSRRNRPTSGEPKSQSYDE
jgi:hypothetical protein